MNLSIANKQKIKPFLFIIYLFIKEKKIDTEFC